MKKLETFVISCILSIFSIFLSACTPLSREEGRIADQIIHSGMKVNTGRVTLPEESKTLLPDYLRHDLTGTGLEFVKVLDDNAAYTRYQISYLSD
jgi:hypothetical protein